MVRSSNNYCSSTFFMLPHADRGRGVGTGGNTRCGEPAGEGRDAFAPNVGTRIFNVDSGIALVDDNAVGGTLDSSGNVSDQSYAYNVYIYGKAFGGSYTKSGTTITVTTSTAHGFNSRYFNVF